jgi:hypothetical protein
MSAGSNGKAHPRAKPLRKLLGYLSHLQTGCFDGGGLVGEGLGGEASEKHVGGGRSTFPVALVFSVGVFSLVQVWPIQKKKSVRGGV